MWEVQQSWPWQKMLKYVYHHPNENAHCLQLCISQEMLRRSVKCVPLYHFSSKNLPWQPAIFLTAHKGASDGKFRSGSQVGSQPSDISLVAIVSERSFCVEWHVWEMCSIPSSNCYSLCAAVLQLSNETFLSSNLQ